MAINYNQIMIITIIFSFSVDLIIIIYYYIYLNVILSHSLKYIVNHKRTYISHDGSRYVKILNLVKGFPRLNIESCSLHFDILNRDRLINFRKI